MSKKVKKAYILCANCHLFNECKAGQAKMRGIRPEYQSYTEIGCYNLEQKQKQLKLVI